MDPLNRSALIIGIEKENIDLINLLLEAGIKVKVNYFVSLERYKNIFLDELLKESQF